MENVTPNWHTTNLFNSAPDTELKQLVDEAYIIYNKNPQIEACIVNDQRQYALEKKREREADKQYLLDKTQQMNIEISSHEKKQGVLDNRGNKRMPAFVSFLFLILRGYFGSITNKKSYGRMRDSQTLCTFFSSIDRPIPSRTCILENINLISNKTRDAILDAQLRHVLKLELDSFTELYVDSTAVEANSTFPSDSGTLYAVLNRCFRYSQKLHLFGVSDLTPGEIPEWLQRMKECHFRISVSAGKPRAQDKMKKQYKRLLRTAQKVHDALIGKWIEVKDVVDAMPIRPSHKDRLSDMCTIMTDDLGAAHDLIYYAEQRVFNGITFPASYKILSISDWAAAFIKKGNREDKLGYKLQLGRSLNGFITCLSLPQGNQPDCKHAVSLVLDQFERTGVLTHSFSSDDGYFAGAVLKELIGLGLEDVSFSGSKGKAAIDEELWDSERYVELRRKRSCVESVIFTLKDQFELGRVRRRGQNEVQAELTEKIIAYNLVRVVRLKKQRQEELERQRLFPQAA